MSYQLELSSNIGQLQVDSGIVSSDATYFNVATSVTAPERLGHPDTVYRMYYRTATTIQPASDPVINFNNSIINATQAQVSSDSFSASNISTFNGSYLVVSLSSDITQRSVFKIDSLSVDSTSHQRDYHVFNLTFDYGNLTTLSDFADVYVSIERPVFNSLDVRDYFSAPGGSIVIDGDKNAINSFLQNAFSTQWQGFPDIATQESSEPGFAAFGRYRLSATDTTADVLITYSITKDGILQDPYVGLLRYQSSADAANPNNVPI